MRGLLTAASLSVLIGFTSCTGSALEGPKVIPGSKPADTSVPDADTLVAPTKTKIKTKTKLKNPIPETKLVSPSSKAVQHN